MSFYIAVILAVVIIDYILLRFLMAALSKIVGAKLNKALTATLEYVIAKRNLSEDVKSEILTVFKDKLNNDKHISKDELACVFKRV